MDVEGTSRASTSKPYVEAHTSLFQHLLSITSGHALNASRNTLPQGHDLRNCCLLEAAQDQHQRCFGFWQQPKEVGLGMHIGFDCLLALTLSQKVNCWTKFAVRYSDSFTSLLSILPPCKAKPATCSALGWWVLPHFLSAISNRTGFAGSIHNEFITNRKESVAGGFAGSAASTRG